MSEVGMPEWLPDDQREKSACAGPPVVPPPSKALHLTLADVTQNVVGERLALAVTRHRSSADDRPSTGKR